MAKNKSNYEKPKKRFNKALYGPVIKKYYSTMKTEDLAKKKNGVSGTHGELPEKKNRVSATHGGLIEKK